MQFLHAGLHADRPRQIRDTRPVEQRPAAVRHPRPQGAQPRVTSQRSRDRMLIEREPRAD